MVNLKLLHCRLSNLAISLAIPFIFWLTAIQVPTEILIQHGGDPTYISLKSPSTIIVRAIWIIGYLSQLLFRVYLAFVKKIEESNELLKWYTVIILGVINLIPPIFSKLTGVSFYWISVIILILQYIMIPAIILLRHENARQYYFSNHSKLHNFVLSVEQFLNSLFVKCFPQEPDVPVEEVVVDDMARESNLKVIAGQAATRLAIARQATQTALILQNTQHLHASNPQAPNLYTPVLQAPNPKAQNPQAPESYTNAQSQTPSTSTQDPQSMYQLQHKKPHFLPEIEIY